MARANNSGSGHKGMSYTKYGYIFIAPFVLAYCIFSLYPLLTTFWYSTGNLKSTTADFWGFSNYDVYYDRYLDLTEFYSDSFDKEVGISKSDYNQIKNFFSAQKTADMYKPLDQNGIQAIIDNGTNSYISQTTIDEVSAALASQDVGLISQASMDELTNWNKNFSDLGISISGKVSSLESSLEAIANPATSEDEGDATAEEVTSETIISADNFQEFIDTLAAGEFTADQQALINYLAAKTEYETLDAYFTAVKNGEASIEDPTFYYVCANLNKPNAVNAAGETIDGIAVPFIATVEEYLAANVWADTITSLNSYANLAAYADGSKSLHDDEETFYADLETLNNAGIISAEKLVVSGDTLVVSDEMKADSNLLVVYRYYIDNAYESNPTEIKAAMQVQKLATYYQNAGRQKLVNAGVDKYITYSGKFDIAKYRQFKASVGLDTVLTVQKYKELDAARKASRVAKAQEDLAKAEAELPAAQAAYDAAVGTDKEQDALNSLKAVEIAVQKAKNTIKDPQGLLSNVDAKTMYIFSGAENYNDIFKNKTRFDTVCGAFVTTAIMWVIGFVPQILLALLLSAWFTDTKLKLKGLSLMKGLMYLPNVITAVTIAVFFKRIFDYSSGGNLAPAQQVLRLFGDEDGFNFFESAWATRFLVCFINFWMWYGNTMIVLIAGITSINESLYESAQIDGANSFQTYTKITMPLLRPILLYTMVTSLIGGLQMYDIPQNLNNKPALIDFNGTYIRSTRTILMYINEQAFGKQDVKAVGVAAATSVVLFIVTTILSVLIFYLMRDKDAAKAKKLMKKGGTGK